MSKRLQLIGKRFYKLKVTDFDSLRPKNKLGQLTTYWKCLCDCGNKTVVRGSTLVEGLTKSCGCLLGSPLSKGEAATNYVMKTYKEQARARNLSFNLSKRVFKKLIFNNCYYCNSSLLNRTNNKQYNGNIAYNGIDRKNNELGYSSKNCVTCCKICNFLKRSMNHNEFLMHIKKISKNMNLLEN